ncbi:MAG: hypothetical protein ACF8PN_16550 [Phycisphaerales bacterium]
MTAHDAQSGRLDRWFKVSLVVGGTATLVALIASIFDFHSSAQGYLIGFLFCLTMGLGALGLLLVHHAVGGPWGDALRPILNAGAATVPIVAIGVIPVLLLVTTLYDWAGEHAHLPGTRGLYLSVPWFVVRSLVAVAVWTILTVLLVRGGSSQPPSAHAVRRVGVGSVGLGLFILTGTFAAVDWIMSLDPHWFSAAFGLHVLLGSALTAFIVSVIAANQMYRDADGSVTIPRKTVRDIGNLFLVVVMAWTYVGFAQYLIIWSGNLQEEVGWFIPRSRGGWMIVAFTLLALNWALPMLALFSGRLKESLSTMAMLALFLFGFRFVEMLWLTTPAFPEEGRGVNWLDFVWPLGLASLWIALFTRTLRRQWPPAATWAYQPVEGGHG